MPKNNEYDYFRDWFEAAIACDLGGDLRDQFHSHRPPKWDRIRRQVRCMP